MMVKTLIKKLQEIEDKNIPVAVKVSKDLYLDISTSLDTEYLNNKKKDKAEVVAVLKLKKQ